MEGYALATVVHVLAVVIWVGGMFFAWMFLRPTAGRQLDDMARLRLWEEVFQRFFPWVWAAVVALLITGFHMIFLVFGGMDSVHPSVHTMLALGLIMMAIFAHVVFAPYRRMRQAIAASDTAEGLRRLGQIRRLVGINTLIGLVTIIVASGGPLMPQ
ncbi:MULTISPECIES: CopD family protein [unclassified Thioalkalivibrio]|uniref:CopD family protein n=1 Tax=unclassified Thioalkalivibrio TaxID=2621013 RepID=UPI0003803172|nr:MULTISPECIES: CopD family protein [unclassified Thioalkalivibrio]